LIDELHLGIPARFLVRLLAILLPTLALAGCMDSDDTRTTLFAADSSTQPFPANYRSELLAFMHTYLNDPVGVHDAVMADPVQRTVGGNMRYVSCLRFAARESDGSYREPRERAVVFVNGRLDHIVSNGGELCAGAAYAPFPDLEQMTR
jgi:hypothetical protein